MLALKEILPEQHALMNVVIQKINDLYKLQQLFVDSEDKFLAGIALKNAGLYMNSLMINGQVNMPLIPAPIDNGATQDDCVNDQVKDLA